MHAHIHSHTRTLTHTQTHTHAHTHPHTHTHTNTHTYTNKHTHMLTCRNTICFQFLDVVGGTHFAYASTYAYAHVYVVYP